MLLHQTCISHGFLIRAPSPTFSSQLRHHSPSQIPPGILLPSNKSRNCLREVGKRPGYFATSQFPTVSNLGHFSGCVICPTSVMCPKHLMPFPLLQEWEHPQFLCVEEHSEQPTWEQGEFLAPQLLQITKKVWKKPVKVYESNPWAALTSFPTALRCLSRGKGCPTYSSFPK